MVRDVHGSIAGNQKTAENWYHNFGLQTFDLNVNQICSLLEKPDVENGEITESIFYNMCTLICYKNNCSSYISISSYEHHSESNYPTRACAKGLSNWFCPSVSLLVCQSGEKFEYRQG